MANYHNHYNHNNRNSHSNHGNHGNHNNHHNRGRNHHNPNRDGYEYRESKDGRESREHRDNRENREPRESRNNRENRDNQAIHSFTLGTKELEGKNAQFQYDKGWYSITDIVGEEKNVIYKSKNAQEAYTKWNVYIGRKKERPQRVEKAE